jgi:hypothetical protein
LLSQSVCCWQHALAARGSAGFTGAPFVCGLTPVSRR